MIYPKRSKLFLFFLLIAFTVFAKDLRRIIRAIEKGDVERTMELIGESLMEDPINPGAKYFLAQHLIYDSLPFFDIDSARIVVESALSDYESSSYKTLEELAKNGLGLVDIQDLSVNVEMLHWRRCLDSMQVSYFISFIDQYPLSTFIPSAERNRDSLNWSFIRPKYDLSDYERFLTDYPTSEFYSEVKKAFDSLLYFESTKSESLQGYVTFLRRNPETPYRAIAEEKIFTKLTASNDPSTFRDFLEQYRTSWLRKKSADILYYLQDSSFVHPHRDSLSQLAQAPSGTLVPHFQNGSYTFFNSKGQFVASKDFDDLPIDYLCGELESDVLFTKAEEWTVINRKGEIIFESSFDNLKELGWGFLYIHDGEKGVLLHKSGFIIRENIEDAEIVGGRWIRVKENGKFGLISFSGYPVSKFRYEQISKTGAFWVFEEDGEIAVYNTEKMLEQLHDEVFDLEFRFDDFEVVQDSFLIGFRRGRESLINHRLEFLIPWGNYEVFPSVPFHYTRADSVYQLYGDFQINGRYARTNHLFESDSWIVFKNDSASWSAINKQKESLITSEADSIQLLGDFVCLITIGDSLKALLPNDSMVFIDSKEELIPLSPVPGTLTTPYFMISKRFEKTVFDKNGAVLFSGNFDNIQPLNDSLFVVEKRNKSGVVGMNGDLLINMEYDLIRAEDNMIFLLKGGKIGGYLIDSATYFDSKYEARLDPFGSLFKTRMNGAFGLIDLEQEIILPFDYDDIKNWNDSLAWLQYEGKWSLTNIYSQQPMVQEVFRYEVISQTKLGTFAKFYSGQGYGLIDIEGEVILEPKFNEIINLGSNEDPIFQVELFSPEAEYYIIFYLNKEGERLASQAYTPLEYEKVLCED